MRSTAIQNSRACVTDRFRSPETGQQKRLTFAFTTVIAAIAFGGCASAPKSSGTASTQPATRKETITSRAPYWYAKPAVTSVICGDYDLLWNTAIDVARDNRFTIDRRDYREGLLTTNPMVSKQMFEIWRSDIVDPHSLAESSLGTVRRTIQFRITREADGRYRCIPKVLVERESFAERRITSVREYRDVFSFNRALSEGGNDEGQPLQVDYWYSTGRDNSLEKRLTGIMQDRLKLRHCEG